MDIQVKGCDIRYAQTPIYYTKCTCADEDYINYLGGLLLMCDIATAFTAISTGVSMMGFFQQQRYDRQEEMYRQQALEMQRRQQEENAKQAMLAAQQRINDRKRQALQNAKSNKASLAASGVNLDSPSFEAFLESSKKTVKQDISRIQINGLTDVVNYQSEARQTGLAKEASLAGLNQGQRLDMVQ